MSEWYNCQKKSSSNLSKFLQERLDKANPLRKTLINEEATKLEKRAAEAWKNLQNQQLQRGLTADEYERLEQEWLKQKEIRAELEVKPDKLCEYE